ncbi:MAG: diacylglycerol kinase family protein [Anaerolineae bacterium]|nr:diacylglycerol kinase family protein [Anaerolineae bacterium]
MRALLRSFSYAFAGLGYAIRTQRNLRIHLIIAVLVVVAAAILQVTAAEWAILLLTIGVVVSAELVNTVAELAVDLLTQEYHPMAKVAKDVGAAAVVTTAIAAVGVGVAVFGPRLWHLLFQ